MIALSCGAHTNHIESRQLLDTTVSRSQQSCDLLCALLICSREQCNLLVLLGDGVQLLVCLLFAKARKLVISSRLSLSGCNIASEWQVQGVVGRINLQNNNGACLKIIWEIDGP